MENLEVINLYHNSSGEKSKEFLEKTQSTLRVKTDTNKVIRDTEWIDMMLFTIPYIDRIFRKPNRFIVNEEEIVKIEQAKKVAVETIKHLSKNTNFIQKIDEETGDVIPSKLLNVRKEESYNTYENRLIYTLVQNMKFFINRRKQFLTAELKNVDSNSDNEKKGKDDKSLEYNANTTVKNEVVNISFNLTSTLDEQSENSKEKIEELLKSIEELEAQITSLSASEVYTIIDKLHISLVKEPIRKTNVILKNVNFQYAMKLWNYLRDNFDEKTTTEEEQKDYNDNGELKGLIDETFLLQYLAMKTLDEDSLEMQDTKEEIEEVILEQLIDKALDVDTELTESKLKQMIEKKYEVIKYKKMEAIQEIQNIFKKHIEKYLENIDKG